VGFKQQSVYLENPSSNTSTAKNKIELKKLIPRVFFKTSRAEDLVHVKLTGHILPNAVCAPVTVSLPVTQTFLLADGCLDKDGEDQEQAVVSEAEGLTAWQTEDLRVLRFSPKKMPVL
jgi:hypothetical protein